MKNKLIVLVVLLVVVVGGWYFATSETQETIHKATITEESLGLRKTSLYTEKKTVASKTEYTGMSPGMSERYERAYTNAPPMIPHSIEGIAIIEKNNNQCVSCHMPDIAEAVGATPIPKSHFINWRPKSGCKDKMFITTADVMKNKTFSRQLKKDLYKGRYNCTQCHAPQSQGNLAVENTFRPDFQQDSEKRQSHLLESLNDGVDLDD